MNVNKDLSTKGCQERSGLSNESYSRKVDQILSLCWIDIVRNFAEEVLLGLYLFRTILFHKMCLLLRNRFNVPMYLEQNAYSSTVRQYYVSNRDSPRNTQK